jgi:UDP-N-acetyl-2-amino-2-deoxyglucuronate dehydrogenase
MAHRRTIRFGLLGAGLVAPFHAKGIQASEGCELVAVADVVAERVQPLASRFGCKAYGSLDQLLGDESIDVINVLTPNHLHRDTVIAAAQSGKHVLVEKPPAMSLKDTDDMIAACRYAGVKLGIALTCRVRKGVQVLRQAVAEGRFGRILQADAYMKWYRSSQYYMSDDWRSQRRSGAGVTIQQAFHYIDLLVYLAGHVRSVEARMRNMMHPEVDLEDTLVCLMDYDSGAQGIVSASTAFWPGTDMRIEINGENGAGVISGERMQTWKFRDERPEDEPIRQLGRTSVSTGATGPADFDFADHQTVIAGMARAIREDTDPLITVDSARHSLEVALAMYQSAASGRPVALPLTDESKIWQQASTQGVSYVGS